jgi:hypothetical protein
MKKLIAAFLRRITRRQPKAAEPSWAEIERANRELAALAASNSQEGEARS